MKAAGLGAGAVGAKVLISKVAPNMNPKLKSAGAIVLGALLPEFAGRSQMMADVGAGIMAVGASELISGFVPGLAGIGEVDPSFDDSVAGGEGEYFIDDDDNAINGNQ